MIRMQADELIERIYAEGKVTGLSGAAHDLHSSIDRHEGEFLTSIIASDPTIRKTLEVGAAYGLSTLYICSSLQDREGGHHTIIDPDQTTAWCGAAINGLLEAGLDFFELVESPSEYALPRMAEASPANFDLVFIDGWHTFDHTLVDCFYALRLLRVGGVLAIDDANLRSVRRVIAFLANYPCLKKIGTVRQGPEKWYVRALAVIMSLPPGRRFWARLLNPALFSQVFERKADMVAFKKVAADERTWAWHDDRF